MVFILARHRDTKISEELLQLKSHRAAHNLFKILEHLFSTLATLYVTRSKNWVPWYIGGSGGLVVDGLIDMPFTSMDRDGYFVGLLLLGLPLQQTIQHFFIRERSLEYSEMSLHHLAHLSLSSSFLFANMIPLGIVVMILHDVSDIPVHMSKFFHLMKFDAMAIVTMILTEITWFWGRLFSLPLLIIDIWQNCVYGAGREHLQPYVIFSLVFLSVLQMLHVYWYMLIQAVIYSSLIGKPKDYQNDLSRFEQPDGKSKEL